MEAYKKAAKATWEYLSFVTCLPLKETHMAKPFARYEVDVISKVPVETEKEIYAAGRVLEHMVESSLSACIEAINNELARAKMPFKLKIRPF